MVTDSGSSPVARVHASLQAADVVTDPAARQPTRSVRSGCGGRNANAGTSGGRAANGSTSAAGDVAANAGPKLAARIHGRP
ncbi:hypothetical protein NDU88_006662 [Pleurodeles waltl]|uniref:Uncharacterized protein n=1 Tax=Pleurodeles waltl TaxID=8319 RepID=A0AAV7TZ12_PLEWA|nr:hypothetical protein NDU88_006662 [Pleurodeles waltl]